MADEMYSSRRTVSDVSDRMYANTAPRPNSVEASVRHRRSLARRVNTDSVARSAIRSPSRSNDIRARYYQPRPVEDLNRGPETRFRQDDRLRNSSEANVEESTFSEATRRFPRQTGMHYPLGEMNNKSSRQWKDYQEVKSSQSIDNFNSSLERRQKSSPRIEFFRENPDSRKRTMKEFKQKGHFASNTDSYASSGESLEETFGSRTTVGGFPRKKAAKLTNENVSQLGEQSYSSGFRAGRDIAEGNYCNRFWRNKGEYTHTQQNETFRHRNDNLISNRSEWNMMENRIPQQLPPLQDGCTPRKSNGRNGQRHNYPLQNAIRHEMPGGRFQSNPANTELHSTHFQVQNTQSMNSLNRSQPQINPPVYVDPNISLVQVGDNNNLSTSRDCSLSPISSDSLASQSPSPGSVGMEFSPANSASNSGSPITSSLPEQSPTVTTSVDSTTQISWSQVISSVNIPTFNIPGSSETPTNVQNVQTATTNPQLEEVTMQLWPPVVQSFEISGQSIPIPPVTVQAIFCREPVQHQTPRREQ